MMLDFSKPLRGIISHEKCEVIKEGLTLVQREDGVYFVVDETGLIEARPPARLSSGRIENVPEDPKDHIALRHNVRGEWHIDSWDGEQLQTKAFLEKYFRNHSMKPDGHFEGYMIIKVPV